MKKWLRRIVFMFMALILVPILCLAVFVGTVLFQHSRIIKAGPPRMAHAHVPTGAAAEVDPFIGTGGYVWMSATNPPGPQVPFGVMRLGPDTASMLVAKEALNRSGYFYSDPYIIGFSHTRLVGTGATDGGHILVTPTTTPVSSDTPAERRHLRFSHAQEAATPGYYTVRLPGEDILVELTCAPQAGIHRYTFAKGTPRLIINASNTMGNKRSEDSHVSVDKTTGRFEGSTTTFGTFASRSGGITVYFAGVIDTPIAGVSTWSDGPLERGRAETAGNNVGVELAFAPVADKTEIELRIAISHVDLSGAKRALEKQVAGVSFDDVVKANHAAWNDVLGRLDVTGGTESQRRIFYTALYRAFQMPTKFSEGDGRYRGFDKEVHQADWGGYYTDMSLWDTFRTVHPLYSLIAPETQRDIIRSLLAMEEQGGYLPRWPAMLGYSGSMLGTPADVVISEAYQKGLAEGGTSDAPNLLMDYDVERAYASMRKTATGPTPPGSKFGGRDDITDYLAYGYGPADLMDEAVARTFEYGWEDHAISELARVLGKPEDSALFLEHSHFYRALFNPENRFFQPRNADGTFATPFEPELLTYLDRDGAATNDYVEGSAWQWRWGAPYDAEAMIALWPSREVFVADLETFMQGAKETVGPLIPGPFYWQGNEHDIHAPYLFAVAGRPDLTQKWVRWVMDTQHSDDHVGLDGNDDGGTLSAWYVWSALGLYPLAGTDRYFVGTPLFPEVRVRLGGGRTLRIVAENYVPNRYLVERVTLNDKVVDGPYITHGDLVGEKDNNESVLRFWMRDEQGKK